MSDQIIHDLNSTRVKQRGLTLSGGDQTAANLADVLTLLTRVRHECPGKDMLVLDRLPESEELNRFNQRGRSRGYPDRWQIYPGAGGSLVALARQQ